MWNYFGQFVWIKKVTIIVAFHFMKRRLITKEVTIMIQKTVLTDQRQIKGSKIAKGFRSAKVLVNWGPFDEFFLEKKSHNAEKN